MKNYNQVSIEAKSKLSNLRQEATQQRHLASHPANRSTNSFATVSAISISIILFIAFAINMGQSSVEVTQTANELFLTVNTEGFLPVANTPELEQQFLVTNVQETMQFMTTNNIMFDIFSVQSQDSEIEQFMADTSKQITPEYFITAQSLTKPMFKPLFLSL